MAILVAIVCLGTRVKITYPSCLSFCPSSALQLQPHSSAMLPSLRLEYEQKSCTIWVYYYQASLLIFTHVHFFEGDFTHAEFLDFAGDSHGESFDKFNDVGNFEMGDIVLAESPYFVFRRRFP